MADTVYVVVAIMGGLFSEAGAYLNPKKAAQEAAKLRERYGIKVGEESNNAVIEIELPIVK